MKIAVGIIGLGLSLFVFMQSCAISGLSNLAEDEAVLTAGGFGLMTSFFMFFGGAFTFGVPRVARILFFLGFLSSLPAWEEFPDMIVWGCFALLLAVMLMFLKKDVKAGSQVEGE